MKVPSLRIILKELYEQEETSLEGTEVDESARDIVAKAIDNTPADYMERSFAQRTPGPSAAGSTFISPQTIETLKAANWTPLTHNRDAIKTHTIAYEANIPGILGAADINDYSDDMEVVIQPAHAGKGIDRETGKMKAEIVGVLPGGMPQVDFTTIILGPNDKGKLQVYTFHPGAPTAQGKKIFLQDMKELFNTESDKIKINLGEAKELGFVTIKHVNNLPEAASPMQNDSSESSEASPSSLQEIYTIARWQKLAGIIKD